jgi:hypothetical protein
LELAAALCENLGALSPCRVNACVSEIMLFLREENKV